MYSSESKLLCVFGGSGKRKGSFTDPVAIEYDGDKLYILNSKESTVSVMDKTDFGRKMIDANYYQNIGQYQKSEKLWKELLIENKNCEPAYDALGKVSMNNSEYSKAMEYFKLSDNRINYSKAFKNYRNELVDENFVLIVSLFFIVILSLILLKRIFNRLSKKDDGLSRMIGKVNYGFYTVTHPFDGFYDLKYENRGTLGYGISMLLILGLTSVLTKNASGYIFNYNDMRYTNVLIDFVSVVLPYVLFAIANWSLTTLMEGKGNFKDIVRYTGYAVIPVIITNLIRLALSHVLTREEQILLTIIGAIGTIWMVFLIFAGTVTTHDYTAGKTVLTLIFTLAGIVIIIFLAMFFISIFQQVIEFIKIIYKDLSLR